MGQRDAFVERLVDHTTCFVWLTQAAKISNTNLRIYSPRWKKSGPTTKCIDPIKPMDVHDVPLSSPVGGPTVKVIRVTSAISTNAHYNLLLDAEEASSLHYTYGVSPDGESGDTRFIMSRKGYEVQPALETAMKAKMAEDGCLMPVEAIANFLLKSKIEKNCKRS